jgi:hypothetical protein
MLIYYDLCTNVQRFVSAACRVSRSTLFIMWALAWLGVRGCRVTLTNEAIYSDNRQTT